jgi:hypothetical protein
MEIVLFAAGQAPEIVLSRAAVLWIPESCRTMSGKTDRKIVSADRKIAKGNNFVTITLA